MIFLNIILILIFIFFNLIIPIFLYTYLQNEKIKYNFEKLKQHRIFSSIALFIFGIITSLIAYFVNYFYFIADIPIIFFILLFLFKIDTFTELFEKIILSLSFPLIIINNFGGIIAGIWLLILGKWSLVFFGVITAFTGGFLLSFILLVPMIFTFPGMFFIEKDYKILGYFFNFLSLLTTIGIISFWCIASLWICYQKSTPEAVIPALIWSYGVAIYPLLAMAEKERDNEFTMLTILFVQLAYIAMLILLIIFNAYFLTGFIVFGSIMLFAMFIEVTMAIYEERKPKWMREAFSINKNNI